MSRKFLIRCPNYEFRHYICCIFWRIPRPVTEQLSRVQETWLVRYNLRWKILRLWSSGYKRQAGHFIFVVEMFVSRKVIGVRVWREDGALRHVASCYTCKWSKTNGRRSLATKGFEIAATNHEKTTTMRRRMAVILNFSNLVGFRNSSFI